MPEDQDLRSTSAKPQISQVILHHTNHIRKLINPLTTTALIATGTAEHSALLQPE
jgi:hypothetical protein